MNASVQIRFLFVLMTLLVVSSACASNTAPVAPSPSPVPNTTVPTFTAMPTADDTAALQAEMQQYDQFVLKMDSQRIAGLFASDGEMVNAGRVTARGPENIRKYLMSFDGQVQVQTNASQIDSLQVTGDTAVMKGTYSQKALVLATKQVVQVSGHFQAEWKRQPNGTWLIERMSTSP
jgi:uncharacterized protein (TIGR02246 family)